MRRLVGEFFALLFHSLVVQGMCLEADRGYSNY